MLYCHVPHAVSKHCGVWHAQAGLDLLCLSMLPDPSCNCLCCCALIRVNASLMLARWSAVYLRWPAKIVKVPFASPCLCSGTYYISDSASNPGDTSDFCKNFGAQMQITVSAAAPTKAPASAPMAASG